MEELKQTIEKNGIRYVLKDGIYYPDLKLPDEQRPIGHYGVVHREWLRKHGHGWLDALCIKGTLWTYLADLNEQAEAMLEQLMSQMAEGEGVTESLKANDQMEWVRRMNNIRNRAEEIVLTELVYVCH